MDETLWARPATELAVRIREGELSPVEVTDAFFSRIDDVNERTNAYVTVTRERARERARDAERALESGEPPGPLHGVPVAIKDLTPVAGVTNTFGSVPFADYVPAENDPTVDRLEAAGAIVLGKTNTSEFGHKAITDNALFGPTSTPFAAGKTAGGSSGGSAAAVADALAPIALGSDAGGSVRIPAAFCGAYGLKPTFGRVPMAGRPNAFNYTAPFFKHGPIARTVADAALMLEVIAGPHGADPFSVPDDGSDFRGATRRPIDDLEIGFTMDLGVYPVDPDVRAVVGDAVDAFETAGASLERATPELGHSHEELLDAMLPAVTVHFATLAAELEAEHGVDLTGEHGDDVDPDLVDRIESGRSVDAVAYQRTGAVRTDVYDAVEAFLREYDLLVMPTAGVTPFPPSSPPETVDGRDVHRLSGWNHTHVFNMTGHPAASIPAGLTDEGLPVGLQVVGRRFDEETVLAASAAFERVRPWRDSYSWVGVD